MEQENLKNIGIGEKDTTMLKPATCKIVKAEIVTVEKNKANKVSCLVMHPQSKDGIKISSVKFENKGKLETSGLWINLDVDNKIKKGSALAIFLKSLRCKNIQELEGKENVETTEDENGYLTFKGY